MVKRKQVSLEGKDKAVGIAGLALDKKAKDVVVLDMRGMTVITDYFVICSGESTTQVKAIAEHIKETLSKESRLKPLGIEGFGHGHWVLLDYGDVVVHVFEESTRAYYELDRLWLDAPKVPIDENPHTVGRKN